MSQEVDQIISPRWLITMDDAHGEGAVLENHSVAIAGDKIVAVDESARIKKTYACENEITLNEHAVIPGLVNAHTHAAMTLLRGFADDLPLMEWLTEHIWPAEQKYANEEFVKVGTDLALAEMIKSGTTCFNDMYFFPEVTATCAEAAGVRACVGMIVIDFPSAWAKDHDEYFNKGLELRDQLRHSSLVTTAFAPHAPYTVDDAALEKVCMLAEEMDCRIHMHLHETAHEVSESMSRYKMRPLERMHQLGLVGPRLTAVHMIHLLPGEMESVADNGVAIVHCPQSNLKLGSGICAVDELLQRNVSVAIGTDGASSNNDLDMFAELQTASLLTKGASQNPAALPAHATLKAATLTGAEALGLAEQIGSITPDKQADLVAVNLSTCNTQPLYNPLSQIVYSAGRHQVSDVWVGGKRLLDDYQLTTLNETEVIQKAAAFAQRLKS